MFSTRRPRAKGEATHPRQGKAPRKLSSLFRHFPRVAQHTLPRSIRISRKYAGCLHRPRQSSRISIRVVRCAMPLRMESDRLGVSAGAESIPAITSSPISSKSLRVCHACLLCRRHHVCLVDLLHPHALDHSLDHHRHARTVLPFHSSFSSLPRHRPAIPSLRRTASKPSCLLPILVDAAHTQHGLPSENIDGFRMLLVCSIYYCSPFLVTLLFFWHPQFLTFRLSSCPVLLRVSCSLSSTSPCLFSLLTCSLCVLRLARLLTLRFNDLGRPLVDY